MVESNYYLAYDTSDGIGCVVFHTFDKKPSVKEMAAALDKQSEVLGYRLKTSDIWFWAKCDG